MEKNKSNSKNDKGLAIGIGTIMLSLTLVLGAAIYDVSRIGDNSKRFSVKFTKKPIVISNNGINTIKNDFCSEVDAYVMEESELENIQTNCQNQEHAHEKIITPKTKFPIF